MATYHVHAINWNETRMLPVFFRHYASASRIFIHDNESDASVQDLVRRAGAELVPFSTGGTFNDVVHQGIKNSAWKASRGRADFVVVQDLDELVHFPWMPGDIPGALDVWKGLGITFSPSRCFCMVATDEEWDQVLASAKEPWTLLRRGSRGDLVTAANYDKVQVFSPREISESNFTPGAHDWKPAGHLRPAPTHLVPLMLHCKHTGQRHETARRLLMRARTSEANRKGGLSWQYQRPEPVIANMVARAYGDRRLADVSSSFDLGSHRIFVSDWTTFLKETFDRCFPAPYRHRAKVLEIGSFEGRGTLMLIDRFCGHPESQVTCVDPWAETYVEGKQEFREWDRFFAGQHARFAYNTRHVRAKIRALRGTSNAVLPGLLEEFDVIYVDGDHHPEQAYRDGVMALPVAKPGGAIIFDDYLWTHQGLGPKEGADRFVREFSNCLEVVHSGPQLVLRVRERWSDPALARTRAVEGVPALLLDTWGPADAMSGPIFQGHAWEPSVCQFVARFFRKNPGGAFVDLGANIGIHTILSVKAGARHAFAFECHPGSLGKLSRNLDLNGCVSRSSVVPFAASSSSGAVLRLSHVPSNVGASFLENVSNRFSSKATERFVCRTIRVDDHKFAPALASFPSILVKIDVEGHELEALKGMAGTLKLDRVKGVIVELNPFTASVPVLAQTVSWLAGQGWGLKALLLEVPPMAWFGPPLPLADEKPFRNVGTDELLGLLRKDVICEVLFSR